MPRCVKRLFYIFEWVAPYFFAGFSALSMFLGWVKLPIEPEQKLAILSAALTVGSILFGFSGVLLAIVSALTGTKIIKFLKKQGKLSAFYFMSIEALVYTSLFVLFSSIALFLPFKSRWQHVIWILFLALAFGKFFLNVMLLARMVWAQLVSEDRPELSEQHESADASLLTSMPLDK